MSVTNDEPDLSASTHDDAVSSSTTAESDARSVDVTHEGTSRSAELVGLLPPNEDDDVNDYDDDYLPSTLPGNFPNKIRKNQAKDVISPEQQKTEDIHSSEHAGLALDIVPKIISGPKNIKSEIQNGKERVYDNAINIIGNENVVNQNDKKDDSAEDDDDYDEDARNYGRFVSFCAKRMTSEEIPKESRTEKRTSQWEVLMRKFSEAHKVECKTFPQDIARQQHSIKQFPTGSTYEGTWDVLGMNGVGTYTFPNGVVYEGDFEEGTFHGYGELRYPEGAILRATWNKGRVVEKTLIFADGLEYDENDWGYCKMPDRRFTIEYDNGLHPGGKSYLTAEQPTRQIPDGYYDTGDGFFDPKSKIIYSADDITNIVRSTGPLEAKWIVENCRTSPDNAVGPRQELYEEWSQPQTDPPPVPPPAVTTRTYKRDIDLSDESNYDDDIFYESLRKSRTSCAASRSHISYSGRPSSTRFNFNPYGGLTSFCVNAEASKASRYNFSSFYID